MFKLSLLGSQIGFCVPLAWIYQSSIADFFPTQKECPPYSYIFSISDLLSAISLKTPGSLFMVNDRDHNSCARGTHFNCVVQVFKPLVGRIKKFFW